MTTAAWEHLAERSHEQPIAAAKARPASMALEHGELMTKDQDLDVLVQILGDLLSGTRLKSPNRRGAIGPNGDPISRAAFGPDPPVVGGDAGR